VVLPRRFSVVRPHALRQGLRDADFETWAAVANAPRPTSRSSHARAAARAWGARGIHPFESPQNVLLGGNCLRSETVDIPGPTSRLQVGIGESVPGNTAWHSRRRTRINWWWATTTVCGAPWMAVVLGWLNRSLPNWRCGGFSRHPAAPRARASRRMAWEFWNCRRAARLGPGAGNRTIE